MKKGFTLIELLAVILILGIIALIAIPTVNKILNEAREGAFRTSSNNIMKAMEEACQTSLIRGENPVLSYIFTDGKSTSKLEIKGTMPNDGYVFLDRECSVTDYFLKDQNYTYSNGEDVRSNYTLKASSESKSIFEEIYSDYYDNIISVNFVNHLNIPGGAIGIADPSSLGENKIKSWLIQNGSGYDLYIGSEKTIFGNENSSYLFSNLISTKKIDLLNFNTSLVKNMEYMFNNCKELISLDVSNLDTKNAKNMSYMFFHCETLKTIDVSNWNVSNTSVFSSIFESCYLVEKLDVSKWERFGTVNLNRMFADCVSIKEINFSLNFNPSKIVFAKQMFETCSNLTSINISSLVLMNIQM